MSDIVVTVNPSQSGPTISIGGGVYPHAATHAPNGSDSLSGYYYPSSNPSGYVSSGDFATTGYVADVSGAIVSQISFPPNVVFTTGVQSISGVKNFYSRPTVNGTGVLLSGEASAASTGYLTGYVSKLETGGFYPTSNPSGYITGVNLSSYQTVSASTGISGYLQGQISSINLSPLQTATGVLDIRVVSLETHTGDYYPRSNPSGYATGSVVRASDTGAFLTTGEGDSRYLAQSSTGIFYPITNPSGYITGVDLNGYSTIPFVTGISGYLGVKILTLQTATGDLNNRSIKALFISGTSTKTVTLVRGDDSTISTTFTDISGDFSGASGYLQGQVDTLNNLTGSTIYSSDTGVFYPIFNPSGYITGVDLSNYPTIGYVTGVSGYLSGEISSLQSATGSYLTGENDPVFAASVAFNIDSSLTGNWTNSYNKSVTGINVAGSTTKTITLYQRDGENISASFTDSEGTGAGADFYIYSGSFDSGNGNLTLNRTGDNGTVVIPLDGRYSTVLTTTGISGYLQNQISAINLAPLQSATGNLNVRVTSLESQTGNYVTGSVIRPSDTGAFYANSNPSGYITGVNLSPYATIDGLTGVSGYLQTHISTLEGQTGSYVTGSIVRPSDTGSFITNSQTGVFYPISNPSGYITGVNLSAYQTIAGSTGISGYLQTQISAINLSPLQTATGVLNTRVTSLESHSGEYYLRTNPSGYITGVDLSSYSTISYVTDVSGHLDGKISTLQTATGDLDNRSIQALFISGEGTKTVTLLRGDGSTISTTFTDISGDFSAPSGYLQNQITNLNNQTGSYVTGNVIRPSQTGAFLTGETEPLFTGSVSFLINSTLTGNWTTSYNKSVTGINVAGSTTKTITLYQRDGGNISASFTDSEGTGAGADFYIYSGSFDSGNGNLTLNRTGDNGTVVIPLDGRYSTIPATNGISGYLQSQISAINLTPLQVATGNLDVRVTYLESTTGSYVTGSVVRPSDTGAFYPRTNPSGYVTGIDLSNYATISSLTGASGHLQSQISSLNGQTGSYTTGNVIRPSDTGAFLTTGAGDFRYVSQEATGSFITSEQTGLFYGASNPSGYITGINLSSYATVIYTTGISGYLQTQISSLNSQTGSYVTGNIVRPSDTGSFVTSSQTGAFYPITNPSGYITGLDLSTYQTIAASTGISGFLQGQVSTLNSATGNLNVRVSSIEGQTGNFALKSATGAFLTTGSADLRFYPLSSNPSSYLVAADISSLASTGYVTGVSGYLQSEINTLNSATGLFYPRNNPSGYITGVDLSSYALQSSVSVINAQSGQWITGYNKSITGLSFSGTDTKTLTLYSRDGATLSANFTDLQGTGASISDIVYLTGDQNISGIKNFYSRPTVNGTGVLLSGEASAGGSSANNYSIIVSGNYSASFGDRILANTSATGFTITLPSTPTTGGTVYLADFARTWQTNNLIVSGNGNKIFYDTGNLICDFSGANIFLTYTNSTIGYNIYYG